MKVDPKGVVEHLRRAEREKNRELADFLADEISSWIAKTDEFEDEVIRLRATLGEMVGALEEIARQRTRAEIEEDGEDLWADFKEGYDSCIEVARLGLTLTRALDATNQGGDDAAE